MAPVKRRTTAARSGTGGSRGYRPAGPKQAWETDPQYPVLLLGDWQLSFERPIDQSQLSLREAMQMARAGETIPESALLAPSPSLTIHIASPNELLRKQEEAIGKVDRRLHLSGRHHEDDQDFITTNDPALIAKLLEYARDHAPQRSNFRVKLEMGEELLAKPDGYLFNASRNEPLLSAMESAGITSDMLKLFVSGSSRTLLNREVAELIKDCAPSQGISPT